MCAARFYKDEPNAPGTSEEMCIRDRFFTLLAVAGFLSLAPVGLFLPVVWIYAFFDSYDLRGRLAAGTAQPDDYLFGLSEMDSRRMNELLRRRHSLIGWGLVGLGAVSYTHLMWSGFCFVVINFRLDFHKIKDYINFVKGA